MTLLRIIVPTLAAWAVDGEPALLGPFAVALLTYIAMSERG